MSKKQKSKRPWNKKKKSKKKYTNLFKRIEKMKQIIPHSQEVNLGPKSQNMELLNFDLKEISSGGSHSLESLEDQVIENINLIMRVVQKGGNMYLERFESFEEKKPSSNSSSKVPAIRNNENESSLKLSNKSSNLFLRYILDQEFEYHK